MASAVYETAEDCGTLIGRRPTWVWGVPLAPLTAVEAVAEIEQRADGDSPSLILSANLNFAMICDRDPEMDAINDGAALILADGMPLVWAGRRADRPIPERVPGSDLIFAVCEMAARRGFSIFLLGGAPGIGEAAARNLTARFPGLNIVGIVSPPYGPNSPEEDAALVARIRDARPDILLMASSQPRGEKWLVKHLEALEVPACLQLGASLDFAAGRVRRAPRLVQKIGMEWAFRLSLEPKRLARRYLDNALFLLRMIVSGPRRSGRPNP